MVNYAQPYLMFRGNVDIQGYSDAVGGQSFTRKMRQTAAMYIILSNQIVYIDELILEQQSNQDRKWSVLFIPPVVMFFMLKFLCYKHVDRTPRLLPSCKIQLGVPLPVQYIHVFFVKS